MRNGFVIRSVPLLLKIGVFTLVMGTVLWFVIAHFQTRSLKNLLFDDLIGRLNGDVIVSRTRLDSFIQQHEKMTRLFVSHQPLIEHITTLFTEMPSNEASRLTRLPSWFPPISTWRSLISPNHFLFLDQNNKLREVISISNKTLPLQLEIIEPLVLSRATGQSYMTMIDNKPYLLTARTIKLNDESGMLLVVAGIDNRFMKKALQNTSGKSYGAITVLASGNQDTVIAHNSLESVLGGRTLASLDLNYVVTGKAFFDMGSSELRLQILTLLPRNKLDSLNTGFLYLDKRQRVITWSILTIFFLSILFYLLQRVRSLSLKVTETASEILGIDEAYIFKGDEIQQLEKRFNHFLLQVKYAQQILKEKNTYEQKNKQLLILNAMAKELDIGVLLWSGNAKPTPSIQMEAFFDQCGEENLITEINSNSNKIILDDVNGTERTFNISRVEIMGGDVACLVHDITRTENALKQIKHESLHDPLTHLPNRMLLFDRFEQAIELAKRTHDQVALLVMDLDRFKEVNDSLGHQAGDLVLQHVSKIINDIVRQSDTFARLGGDEFAIVLPAVDLGGAIILCKKIEDILAQPFNVKGEQINIGNSIGLSIYPEHGNTPQDLMQRADLAMYSAKNSQVGYCIYENKMVVNAQETLSLSNSLRQAITHHEFVLHYQPQINLQTGEVTSVEALVRWNHPEKGLLYPDMFISLAEKNGLILPMTDQILGMALKQVAYWKQQGKDLKVSVNLSARGLHDPELTRKIKKTLRDNGLLSESLILEITEGAIMFDPIGALDQLRQLNEFGICVAVDDFGTGYSSLSYLKELPVKELKIDRSFVMDMCGDKNDHVIVKSTIELAHNLGLYVVAEGIENQQIVQALLKLGCDKGQGYYFSKPLAVIELDQWFSSLSVSENTKSLYLNLDS